MITFIDCTLRDGGYYNNWDFPKQVIEDYLQAMAAIFVDYAEIGFRFTSTEGFKGGCAYTTDEFVCQLSVPPSMKLGVMVNANDVVNKATGVEQALQALFAPRRDSPIELVRIACHLHEFEESLEGCAWLKEQGYKVGINLMQIADRSEQEIEDAATRAIAYPIDVLYFADSMGSMTPEHTARIVSIIRRKWTGPLGIHTHDNMGYALANTIRAIDTGVSWIDSTVTGMGRGPGNAKTEYVALELERYDARTRNPTPLLTLIRKFFRPMQIEHGWGTNAFYYLAGKYSIHPTYIQEMLADSRYSEEDVLAVIEHLRQTGGQRFSLNNLQSARSFFVGSPRGTWAPVTALKGRDVLIVGAGPSVARHKDAIEAFIRKKQPFVIALNTQRGLSDSLIDARAACHPIRLLADCQAHHEFRQPLITPLSMLPVDVRNGLTNKKIYDFGAGISPNSFEFAERYCVLPNCLVISYALAAATSGDAARIFLAGFDGFSADDPRKSEMDSVFESYLRASAAKPVISITPTNYSIAKTSVYAIRG